MSQDEPIEGLDPGLDGNAGKEGVTSSPREAEALSSLDEGALGPYLAANGLLTERIRAKVKEQELDGAMLVEFSEAQLKECGFTQAQVREMKLRNT